jgi:hypothetical protein
VWENVTGINALQKMNMIEILKKVPAINKSVARYF